MTAFLRSLDTWVGGVMSGWRRRREHAAVQRRPIPDDLWKRTLVRYPFLRQDDPADALALRRLASLFLDRKEFHTTQGLRLTDAMAVSVAAQAVLPILKLPQGLAAFDSFVGIVLHPDAVRARRQHVDDAGVVHEHAEVLAGEAMERGPVMLSWRDVRSRANSGPTGRGPAYNVVIHEFAHVLDMTNGQSDGVPLLPNHLPLAVWQATLSASFELFCQRVREDDHIAAEAEQEYAPMAAGRAPPDPAWTIDPYGSQGLDEFFACASESFFTQARGLRAEDAALYRLLSSYYGQDPAAQACART